MTSQAFPLDVNESNLVALAIDFYISQIGDLSPEQYDRLLSLLMQFEDYLEEHEAKVLDNQHEKVQDRQGNLLRVDFGKNLD